MVKFLYKQKFQPRVVLANCLFTVIWKEMSYIFAKRLSYCCQSNWSHTYFM